MFLCQSLFSDKVAGKLLLVRKNAVSMQYLVADGSQLRVLSESCTVLGFLSLVPTERYFFGDRIKTVATFIHRR